MRVGQEVRPARRLGAVALGRARQGRRRSLLGHLERAGPHLHRSRGVVRAADRDRRRPRHQACAEGKLGGGPRRRPAAAEVPGDRCGDGQLSAPAPPNPRSVGGARPAGGGAAPAASPLRRAARAERIRRARLAPRRGRARADQARLRADARAGPRADGVVPGRRPAGRLGALLCVLRAPRRRSFVLGSGAARARRLVHSP